MRYKIISTACMLGIFTLGMLQTGVFQIGSQNRDVIKASAATMEAMIPEFAAPTAPFIMKNPLDETLGPEVPSGQTEPFTVSGGDAETELSSGLQTAAPEREANEASGASGALTAENENNSTEEENEYADLAIANVEHYVNVRTKPNTDSSIVGKIYSGAVAQVLEVTGEENDWFRIVSGEVEGYIKAEFFLYGEAAAAVIDNYVIRYATVLADRLNVRENPDLSAARLGYINKDEKIKALENQGDWIKVQYTDAKIGYVAAEYVTVSEEFTYAKTLEEEAAELAARRALEERQNVPEASAAENTSISVTPPEGAYETSSELRSAIIEYANQFLGNKYVHGGQSLESGTDCSGFTSLIYAEFGYSLSRTPSGQLSNAGRSVDYSEAQIGDVICYGSGGKCTHVALYIGDGQIIHSANPRKGVVIGNAEYDTILGVKNVID